MTSGWGRRALAIAAALPLADPAFAQLSPGQPVPGAEIDPSAPLDPLPDIDVDWPDLGQPGDLPAATDAPIALPSPPLGTEVAELSYRLILQGLETAAGTPVEGLFRQNSVLLGDRSKRANAATLDRRARADAELLREALRSEGFYDAAVTPTVAAESAGSVVTLSAQPGRRYTFSGVDLPGLDAAGEDAAALRNSFAVRSGDPVVAQQVIAAGVALRIALGRLGFALAEFGEQEIVVDHQTGTARLVLPVRTGPFQRFGRVRVSGDPPLGAEHVQRIARWQPGERFRQDRVDDLRRALLATGLVATADVVVAPAAESNRVDLNVRLTPAPPRTIAGEAGYGTGEGVRVEASWQHRNFFNPEGALTVRGVLGTQEQLIGASVRRSNWRRRDQVLVAQASASNTNRDAFEARTIQIGASVERQTTFIWHKKWTWSLGAEMLASEEEGGITPRIADPQPRTFFIGALPASLGYDASDDLLDPTRGFRLSGRVSPEVSRQGRRTSTYLVMQLDGSAYHPVADKVVAAGRIRLASISGAGRDDIAPSRRLYSGGGGSVRGYAYQRLGPKDLDNNPIGGRGLAELSVEARVRLGNFGIVPFLDAGSVSENTLPSFDDWQFAVGIGGRYYSSFGPIRIDVGTPLNRRPGDSRFAVTVSLGQAF